MVQYAMLTVVLVLLPLARAATAPLERLLILPFNVTRGGDSPYTRLSSVRGDYDEVLKIATCAKNQGCTTCPECTGQADYCASKCMINCTCGCYGVPGSSLNFDNAVLADSCRKRKGCDAVYNQCLSACKANTDCLATCYLAELQCVCPCNQLTIPSSTPAPSAAASARPAGLVGVLAALCVALASRR